MQIGAGEMEEFESSLSRAHSWLKLTQIKENVDVKYYRQMNLVRSVYSTYLCNLNWFDFV